MGDFNRYSKFDKRDSGRSDKRDSGRYGDRDSGRSGGRDFGKRSFEKQMHEVTCDKCGKRCEVPFKPSGDKPVYCSDCFRQQNESSDRYGDRDSKKFDRGSYNRSGGRDSGRSGSRDSERYTSRDSGSSKPEQFTKEFEQLNRKLDTILKALEVSKKEQVIEEPVKEPEKTEKKVVKKKAVKKVVKKKEPLKTKKKKTAAKKSVKKS